MSKHKLIRAFALMWIIFAFSTPLNAAGPKTDFNGDGKADLFLRDIFTGDISVWLINGSQVLQKTSLGNVAPKSGLIPIGIKDFNGDGYSDLFWYNVNTGDISAWFLNGGTVLQKAGYGAKSRSNGWAPIALDDFNGDGRADVLWYNAYSGGIMIWFINGSQVLQKVSYGIVDPKGWTPLGAKDVNGDGISDLFWYNVNTGGISTWSLNGGTVLQTAAYGAKSRSNGWSPISLEDFNGDGRADVLWYNGYTGDIVAWFLNGTQVIGTEPWGNNPPNSGWTPMGLNDLNSDGRADLLWYNGNTGGTIAWLHNNQSASYGAKLPSNGWAPLGLDDFNGDGQADLFWFNGFTNATKTWLLSGNGVLQIADYGGLPPRSVWQVQIPPR